MYSAALKQYEAYLRDTTSADLQDDLEQIIHNKDMGETEKSTYINARVGQGRYRKDLINYWGQCALTGFEDTRFLVASHIKPWKNQTITNAWITTMDYCCYPIWIKYLTWVS